MIIEYCQTRASRGIITEAHKHSMPMKNNSRLAINFVFIQGAYQTERNLVHFYLPVSLKYKKRVDYYEKKGDKQNACCLCTMKLLLLLVVNVYMG